MQSPVHEPLLRALGKIDRPGTFCTHGVLPAIFPGLTVAGEGPVALPLASHQAESLKKRARQAPYGKGTKTLVDVDVRRVWEIDAEKVSFANPAWDAALRQLVERVQIELGLEEQKLSAHLYKLLLYEAGSFFLPHRDGEKLERMVGTLVVALPSPHTGGVLVVRHDGREESVDFAPKSPYEIQFAAFYADCEHEVRPVESGFRLALVYNLTLPKTRAIPSAPTSSGHVAAVAGVLRDWKKSAASAARRSGTGKLAVVLDHKYTEAGLSLATLKGLDRAKADALFAAARQAECDAYLALVVYWQSGCAESDDEGGYDDYEEAEDYEMGDLIDDGYSAERFCDSQGVPTGFGKLPLDEGEVVSKKPLGQGLADREEFEGYTGNAGMTLDRWYHRAAVVLWPSSARFDVLCEGGAASAVGGLAAMVAGLPQVDAEDRPALLKECLKFVDRIISHWEPPAPVDNFTVEDESKEPPAPFLAVLAAIGDPSRIAAWIRKVLAKDPSIDPDKLLGDLCEAHGWKTFEADLAILFQSTSPATLLRHARLLADWSLRDGGREPERVCNALATDLMAVLEQTTLDPPRDPWDRKPKIDLPDLLSLLLKSFVGLRRDDLLDRLRAYVLERPAQFVLTTVQLPTLSALGPWLEKHLEIPLPAIERWWTVLRKTLEARIAAPPQPPADERRAADFPCKCTECKVLRTFLEDPHLKTFRLAAHGGRRDHLERIVKDHKLDTTHVTERKGRPFSLVFTKTAASHQAAMKAHRIDLEQLERLRELEAWHGRLPTSAPQPKKKAAVKKAATKAVPRKRG